jgi:hypothetical protein
MRRFPATPVRRGKKRSHLDCQMGVVLSQMGVVVAVAPTNSVQRVRDTKAPCFQRV